MRTVAHISDVHFGRINPATVQPLIRAIHELQPSVVAVSGDLTQRAHSSEFRDARKFLDALPAPQIVVPGNHDVPLHNLYARFARSLEKYRHYISDDLEPYYQDDEIAVAGVNTARAAVWKGGRMGTREIERLRQRLCATSPGVIKFVVTHHPFELPTGMSSRALVGRAHRAMAQLASCGADVFLAGHLHLNFTAHSAVRYEISGHSALVVQAGTATSSRGRGEANSFNVIRTEGRRATVQKMEWNADADRFVLTAADGFEREGNTWLPLNQEDPAPLIGQIEP